MACLRVEEDTTKGERVNHLIHGKIISHHLPLFPRKSRTKTVVMTEEMGMAGMTGVM
jgi:hypothetical protein